MGFMNEKAQEMHQPGALPILVNPDGSFEVCLITSRGGRWIIPNGNPIRGLTPQEVAAQEALDEAGGCRPSRTALHRDVHFQQASWWARNELFS